MIEAILLFLAVSLLLYALLAGADFGAGILELSLGLKSSRDERSLIARAMAPVWEANHIWLILVVVILFIAFPSVYTSLCNLLFVPVMALLLGIVVRGCAFVFRYYDTSSSESLRRRYSQMFAISSAVATFFLGVIAGAMTYGKLDPDPLNFWEGYMRPWFNWHCIFTGLFSCALFSFLAALYLSGEAKARDLQLLFQKKAMSSSLVVMVWGALVFATDQQASLTQAFVRTPLSLVCFVVATVLMGLLWYCFRFRELTTRLRFWTRAAGAGVVTLVLLGWFAVVFPAALVFKSGVLTYYEAAAPPIVLKYLLGALVLGVVLIIPALYYLFRVFKWDVLETGD